ncbi:MAG: DUF4159 domain-containing protein [Planctomycetes bacterium]|nr:DUF4159 domain-containing protein [Planctomycetota bacterium]
MMRSFWIALSLSMTLSVSPGLAAGSAQTAGDGFDERVDAAIAKAVGYLWGRHQTDRWPEDDPGAGPQDYGAQTALCVYTMLSAGQSYQTDRMAVTIDWLVRLNLQSVYARSLRVMALSMLPGQKAEKVLADDVRRLLAAARSDGTYPYTASRGVPNTAMVHTAVFFGGAERGNAVPGRYWRDGERHWRQTQTAEGGWSYNLSLRPAQGSISAAALSSLLLCHDAAYRQEYFQYKGDDASPAIRRGLAWLGGNFSALENPAMGPQYYYYYLYAVQQVGVASGYKYFGPHDWYREGAEELMRSQGVDGCWRSDVDTCFALLFLASGRYPVVFNKLQYDGAWNTRPRDMAHVARWLARTFETPVRWQVLDIGADEDRWGDSPILYISGSAVPKFSPSDIAKLHDYAMKGGLIVSEAAGSSPAFNLAMQKAYREIFPRLSPEPISPSHRIFSAHDPVKRPISLTGISNGVRLLAIHSPGDLSKAWQADTRETQGDSDRFQLAANIYFHATDFGSLRQKRPDFEELWPKATAAAEGSKRMIRVALLTHEGGANPEPFAYKRLAMLMAKDCDTKLVFGDPTPIADLSSGAAPIALMTGTGAFRLQMQEKIALREFINAGGLVVADAAGGSDAFDKAARTELLTLLADAYPQVGTLSSTSEIYTLAGWSIKEVTYRPAARVIYGNDRSGRLEAVIVNGQPAIVYSRDDITAGLVGYTGGNIRGYSPASAFAIMRNLLLYAAGREKPKKPILKGFLDVQWDPVKR